MRTFTKEEYEDLRARDIPYFKEFVMNKFFEYTQREKVLAGRSYLDDPRTNEIGVVLSSKANYGWGGWIVLPDYLFADNSFFVVCHYLDDERAPRSYDSYVKLPKDFVFGEEDPEYLEYLRLEAKYGERQEATQAQGKA